MLLFNSTPPVAQSALNKCKECNKSLATTAHTPSIKSDEENTPILPTSHFLPFKTHLTPFVMALVLRIFKGAKKKQE
tara:strand:+ start:276 stop:506 length:231 start_codon:yes stop_codon:yes gene_type:complete